MSSVAQNTARNAVVVGMGRTGLSVARHLQRCGYGIAVTDSRDAPPELAGVKALGSSVVTRTGGFDARLLEKADIVVTSPGVPLDDPFFVQARSRGLDIVGDIELFARAADAPVVGITGTNGKSTVTTLLGRMAERAGVRVRVGGNLGQPALDLLDRGPTDLYVLELSSFQLDTTHSLKLKAAVVLNVSADHMDRYATLDHYAASKARIYANSETAVVNADEQEVVKMPRTGQRVISFGLQDAQADFGLVTPPADKLPWLARRGAALLPVASLKISGRHNAANALATLALGDALRLPMAPMLDELREFTGLPHRSQWVADVAGVRYINDSKGTNVGATLAAVGGLSGPLVVIAGGDGKGQDFSPLAAAFRGKVRDAVLLGRDASLLEIALAGTCTTSRVGSMEDAVRTAARLARAGDTVLLSPACSSLDMFRDYAHRGNVFSAAVQELIPMSGKNRTLHIDAVALSLVAAIVLLGLIMVTSASISIASKESGDAFSYLERQLMLCLTGFVLAAMVFCIRTEYLEKMAWPLLIAAVALLFFVLVPGLGHVVNGSRRWIRIVGFNFQASELARVLVLIFIASYAVRREQELRTTALGLIKPMGMLAFIALLLLAEPDFGAASVLFISGFGILFIAGARLRYVLIAAAAGAGAMALLVMLVPYRMARVTSFLDPWADPYNSGFQLTQSLIAIGRGEWFGVGLGESVQKLFYLPEAHTDFLFAVLAEELGLVGVAVTLALFIGLVWRSFWIAQLASRAGMRFQAYLAAGFGLWLGAQALINIGVNMGVLPTKGLTLPLMSYGRSSMIVTLAWIGLLLRVYHEAMQNTRGMASVRRADSESPRTARLAGAT